MEQDLHMEMSTLEISDEEFIEQYRSLNVFHRKIISEACLKSFDQGNEQIRRSIGVEITYQYVSLLEDLAMVFFAIKNFQKNDNSFLKAFFNVFIQENSPELSTEALINEITRLLGLSFKDLLSELNLPTFESIQSEMSLTSEEEKNIQELKTQYEQEIRKTVEVIQTVVSNRKYGKDGNPFDLVKIGNKIKHGSMFLLNYQDDEAVFYPMKVKVVGERSQIKGYYLISSNKDSLQSMVDNMHHIAGLISDLLLIFSKYLAQRKQSE